MEALSFSKGQNKSSKQNQSHEIYFLCSVSSAEFLSQDKVNAMLQDTVTNLSESQLLLSQECCSSHHGAALQRGERGVETLVFVQSIRELVAPRGLKQGLLTLHKVQ